MLGLEELGSNQGRGFASGPGGSTRSLDGICTIGHLYAACHGAILVAECQFLYSNPIPELEIRGLAREEMTGARHEIGHRNTSRPRLLKGAIEDINRIEDPDSGLNGRRSVASLDFPNVRVSADQAREQDLALQVDDLGSLGNGDFASFADGRDGLSFHKENAICDFRGRDGNDPGPHVSLDRRWVFCPATQRPYRDDREKHQWNEVTQGGKHENLLQHREALRHWEKRRE